MDSLQNLKSRLRAVKNISQITKAMEVVSATKMRRAQEIALRSRPYAFKALEVLEKILRNAPVAIPLMAERPVKKTLVVLVASDRGLAGSFNAQVFRAAEAFLSSDVAKKDSRHSFALTAVGRKANAYALKKGLELAGSFQGFGDFIESREVEPLTELIVQGFEAKRWDRVVTVSTHFRTTLKQETLIRQVLPTSFEKIREIVKEIVPEEGRYSTLKGEVLIAPAEETEYIFEPSPEEVVRSLVPELLRMQMYHLILEANASEHSARRVAMKNASDNADGLSGELTLGYNKARQASITKEIIEITSTQNALSA